MFTDTHCHILSDKFYDPLNVIDNLERDNIRRIIINGFNIKSNCEVMDLINNKNVYGALGIHPDNISDFNDSAKNFINENIKNKKIIAIGEIGLDYWHNKENKKEQLQMLEYFLGVAENNNLPVIIHSREATGDLLDLLKKHKCKGIIHCFSGSLETAREYIKLGYKLGIGGVLTFKNCNLKDVLKEIDLKDILLETDSPYLAPEPKRGTRNDSRNVKLVAQKVADFKNIKIEEVAKASYENAYKIFTKIMKK